MLHGLNENRDIDTSFRRHQTRETPRTRLTLKWTAAYLAAPKRGSSILAIHQYGPACVRKVRRATRWLRPEVALGIRKSLRSDFSSQVAARPAIPQPHAQARQLGASGLLPGVAPVLMTGAAGFPSLWEPFPLVGRHLVHTD